MNPITTYADKIRSACKGGDLQWLKANVASRVEDFFFKTLRGTSPFNSAAAMGHLEVVKWLVSKISNLQQSHSEASEHIRDAVVLASSNGHIDLVKWLTTESGFEVPGDFGVLTAAAYKNHLDVIKWLVIQTRVDLDEVRMVVEDLETMNTAAETQLFLREYQSLRDSGISEEVIRELSFENCSTAVREPTRKCVPRV